MAKKMINNHGPAERADPLLDGKPSVCSRLPSTYCRQLPGVCSTRSAPHSGAADLIASRIPPGLGCWIEGPWPRNAHKHGLGPWMKGPWRRSIQRGNATNMVATSPRNCSKMVPKWYQHGCQIGPGGLLEGSWRSLRALRQAWSAKGGLPGAYGALLEASWVALGVENWGPKGS